ncbi:MAG: phosphatidylglycerophosphatase A [Syntrophorhabdaceae bacterium]|nr:phosphatidylglycerophosphatase A [Syntrophorhabdaceae bacterium]
MSIKNSITNRFLLFLVTCGFIGYLPYIPGTFTSILACLILYFFSFRTLFAWFIFLIFFVPFSVMCINKLNFEGKDPRYIVIDEFAGMFITMAGHKTEIINLLTGFILFRFFDIVKPYPVKYVEKYKKGYGIMADDVVAGILANICLCLFIYIWDAFK